MRSLRPRPENRLVATPSGAMIPAWKLAEEERRNRLMQVVAHLAGLALSLPFENDGGRDTCRSLIASTMFDGYSWGEQGRADEMGESMDRAVTNRWLTEEQVRPVREWLEGRIREAGEHAR